MKRGPAAARHDPTDSYIAEVIGRKRADLRDPPPESELPLPEDRSGRRRRREPIAPSTVDPDDLEVDGPDEQYAPDTTTYIHDALPAVWMDYDLTPVQIAIVYQLLSVAGWNIRGNNKRYASCGHRQIAQRLAGTVPERTVLRHLKGLADGYPSRTGVWVPGRDLIRIVKRGDRRRNLIDLMPLYKAIDAFRPGAMAFLLRRPQR